MISDIMNTYSDVLDVEEVNKILESSLNTTNFKLLNFCIKPLSENVIGFLGQHLRLTVKLIENGNEKERIFFVKSGPPEGTVKYDLTIKSGAFRREIDVYTSIMNEMTNVKKHKKNDFLEIWCPKFHYNRGDELLVLDDISSAGYKIATEREALDKDHVLVGLRTLAKMHSSWYAIEKRLNENMKHGDSCVQYTLAEMCPNLTKEMIFTDEKGHPFTHWCEKNVASCYVYTEYIDGYTDEELKKVEEKIWSVMKEIVMLVKPSKKYRNVLLHGDLWSNNILFRYENGKPVSGKLIDFQLARYGPPAHDVMDFLYFSTTKEQRRDLETEFKQYYYNQFENELHKYELSVIDFFTLERFMESCEDYRKLGIIKSIIIHSIVLTPPHLTSLADSSSEKYGDFMVEDREYFLRESFKDDIYKRRIMENFKELIDTYIIV